MKNMEKIKKIIAGVLVAILVVVTVAILKINATNTSGGVTTKESAEGQTSAEKAANYESIFEKDRVIDIKVEIAEEDWKSILADPMAEEYKSATVTVDGVTIQNAGFRTKGNLTLRSVANSTSDRYSFRIKLDKYVEGQNLLGLDEFVINNMYSDPSYLREYLSYEALKEVGADVPAAVFANIYINGELFGFYLCVEAIDDSFLERNFGNNDGSLYKQEQGSTLQYIQGSNYDSSELKTGDDETKTDLKNFIQTLNEMPQGQKGNIESVLDVDSALKYIAANTVLGNYDSYSGNLSHNYYLYAQEGKFTVIPWDYNMSIAGFGGGGGGDAATIPIDEPVTGVNIKNLPLINNLLAVEEYKEKYHEYVKDYLDYLENFEERVTELAAMIQPYVQADPTKFYTMEQFEASTKYSETNVDTTTTAVQNTEGNPVNERQGQLPQDMPGGFANGNRQMPLPEGEGGNNENGRQQQMPQDMLGGFANGNQQALPQGGMGGNMRGGPDGGMGMMGSSTSIVNFIKDRVENIKKQLAGELPTTGNTTMNNAMGGGNRRNR